MKKNIGKNIPKVFTKSIIKLLKWNDYELSDKVFLKLKNHHYTTHIAYQLFLPIIVLLISAPKLRVVRSEQRM